MTKGSPAKLIFTFAIPLMLGNVFQQFYTVVDTAIVGQALGVNALAALGAADWLNWLVLGLIQGFAQGFSIYMAQRFGAEDHEGLNRSIGATISLSAVISILTVILSQVAMAPVLRAMNTPEEIIGGAFTYLRIMFAGIPIIMAYNVLASILRALGDSKTPLYFLIFSSVLNIIFNLVLIKFCRLGVIGSAVGTVIAISISVVCCIIYIKRNYPILRLKKEDWAYNPAFMREHLNIAIPMSIQFSILALSIMVIQAVCNSFGEKIIVGFTIALRIEQLATQPLMAIGLAMATFAAQNYGAGKLSRIREAVKKACLTSFVISLLMSTVMFFFGTHIIGSFLDNPDPFVVQIGASYLGISIMFYFFLGMIFIFKNTLQSMGKPLYPVLSGFIELGIRSFAAVWLASKIGYQGIYYASPLAWVGGSIVVFAGYYFNVYLRKESDIKKEYRDLYKRMKAA